MTAREINSLQSLVSRHIFHGQHLPEVKKRRYIYIGRFLMIERQLPLHFTRDPTRQDCPRALIPRETHVVRSVNFASLLPSLPRLFHCPRFTSFIRLFGRVCVVYGTAQQINSSLNSLSRMLGDDD